MNGAHKQSIEEQEKAKFSFSGATLYGINAVIGSGMGRAGLLGTGLQQSRSIKIFPA